MNSLLDKIEYLKKIVKNLGPSSFEDLEETRKLADVKQKDLALWLDFSRETFSTMAKSKTRLKMPQRYAAYSFFCSLLEKEPLSYEVFLRKAKKQIQTTIT